MRPSWAKAAAGALTFMVVAGLAFLPARLLLPDRAGAPDAVTVPETTATHQIELIPQPAHGAHRAPRRVFASHAAVASIEHASIVHAAAARHATRTRTTTRVAPVEKSGAGQAAPAPALSSGVHAMAATVLAAPEQITATPIALSDLATAAQPAATTATTTTTTAPEQKPSGKKSHKQAHARDQHAGAHQKAPAPAPAAPAPAKPAAGPKKHDHAPAPPTAPADNGHGDGHGHNK